MRILMVTLTATLSGCVSHSGVHPLRPHDLATGPYQSVATAALTGSLLYEGSCLLFRDDENHVQLFPVWPVGSEFNGSLVVFHQPGKTEQRVVVGEEFLLQGRPATWSSLPGTTYEQFQAQCQSPPFIVSGVKPAN